MSYAHPDSLVSTQWVDEHKDDPNVRVVEVDVDTNAFEEGHVPGALAWDWSKDLCDQRLRDVLARSAMEELLRAAGIGESTRVVLYGDNNNWFAAWALWQMEMFGHRNVCLMNGGRTKWLAEGRALSLERVTPKRTSYVLPAIDERARMTLEVLRPLVEQREIHLVDVRSPAEFSGQILSPPGLPETCQRGGHIPGASNVPWATVCGADGTFKTREELEALFAKVHVDASRPIVAYCRIGERSSHMWFVLTHLLGHENVTNYDGSWTEWGNLVKAPIEVGAQ